MEVVKIRKADKVSMLLELDDLIRSESKDAKRITELRNALEINEKKKVKSNFPANSYYKMKASGMNDAECIFFMGVNYERLDKFKEENAEKLNKEMKKYDDHYMVERYNNRIQKEVKIQFPADQYYRMKAMGLSDLECSLLLVISTKTIDVFKKENEQIINKGIKKYQDNYIISAFKKRILKRFF